MHLDPVIPVLCAVVTVVLVLAAVLRRFHQPHVVAYILAGLLLGPGGFGLIDNAEAMGQLGAVGIVLLLFFVGMEVNLPALLARWRIAIVGTVLQIVISVAAIWVLGQILDWGFNRIVLLGFVISLSSTAVVIRMLQDSGEANTAIGHGVTGILLVQDLAIIPMMIVLGILGGDGFSPALLVGQTVGAVAIGALVIWVLRRRELPIPIARLAGEDHELQLLVALLVCFGLALVTGALGLSTALGAFVGGIIIGSSRHTEWIHEHLASFRVLFVGAFFVSIGMLIRTDFLLSQWPVLLTLLAAVLLTNTFINAGVLRLLDQPWRDSIYAGGLLAQVGELSFLLVAIGWQAGIIGEFAYHATVGTIALSLTVSPAWIALVRRLTGHRPPARSGVPTQTGS